jgi:hypothetical protein
VTGRADTPDTPMQAPTANSLMVATNPANQPRLQTARGAGLAARLTWRGRSRTEPRPLTGRRLAVAIATDLGRLARQGCRLAGHDRA